MPVVVVPQRWWSVGRSLHDSPTLPTYSVSDVLCSSEQCVPTTVRILSHPRYNSP